MISCIKNFLLFFFLILLGCKKDISSGRTSLQPATDSSGTYYDYLGTFGATELTDSIISTTLDNYLDGYTDEWCYNVGDTVNLYLTSNIQQGTITIPVKDVNSAAISNFQAVIAKQAMSNAKPWLNGFGFNKTASFKIGSTFKSGYYSLNHTIPFIVKGNNNLQHDITVVYPSNTVDAYNANGGKSLYRPHIPTRSYVVSFLRPKDPGQESYWLPFLKWINNQPYDINYITDQEMDDYKNIEKSKVLIIIGHSEYWTRRGRENFDKFVEGGKNALILSGNTMWWQVRYNMQKKIMICYKDKLIDPLANTLYTTYQWNDSSLNYSPLNSTGVTFAGYGNVLNNRWNGYKIVEENSPLFEGTGLTNGQILSVPTFEYDGAPLVKNINPGSNEIPVLDKQKLNFNKVELLGYDFTCRDYTGKDTSKKSVATFIVFQPRAASGTVVNVASENWCSSTGIDGTDKGRIRLITNNMINKSLAGSTLFAR